MEKMNRRKFLKLGALCAAGATAAVATTGNVANASSAAGVMKKNDNRIKGESLAMVIDMNKLNNLDELQERCHKFHNVPNIDTEKDQIMWIWGETFEALFPDEAHERMGEKFKDKEFATLCNHCEDPVCVRVCPTKATFKNDQGIIGMDMHRCIGCRNCMAACPYGARSFNFKDPRDYLDEINPTYPTRMKGVVEKCDFCVERLAEGKLPLCVEHSNGAIVFGDLNDPESTVNRLLRDNFTLQRKRSLGTNPKVYYIV